MQRASAVDNFRSGKTWVLIATDVISRGMDFKGINCVINYDFPDSAAAYIHRIGTLNVECPVLFYFDSINCSNRLVLFDCICGTTTKSGALTFI